jgi:hypothetical protein
VHKSVRYVGRCRRGSPRVSWIGEGREVTMDKAWAGVDAGKEFHWAHLLDASGRELLSRKVENDEAEILKLIDD